MKPGEVEAIVGACMAVLEKRLGCARPDLMGEFADLGLRREALEYAAKRDVAVTDWMVSLGIDRDLTGLEMLGVARAEIGGREWTPPDGGQTITTRPLWVPHPDGRPVITLPVWNGESCLDILALDPRNANKWWTRTDLVPVLGDEEIARCEFLDEPLTVHRNPLAWLRAGACGTVILDWHANVAFWLSGARRLLCHEVHTAKRLDRALKHPQPTFEIKLAKEPIDAAA